MIIKVKIRKKIYITARKLVVGETTPWKYSKLMRSPQSLSPAISQEYASYPRPFLIQICWRSRKNWICQTPHFYIKTIWAITYAGSRPTQNRNRTLWSRNAGCSPYTMGNRRLSSRWTRKFWFCSFSVVWTRRRYKCPSKIQSSYFEWPGSYSNKWRDIIPVI